MPHTIILAGGGTGGHVYPALAMGDALKARGHDVRYYGDGARLEGRVAAQRGYTFRPVGAVPYPRAGVAAKLRFVLDLGRATLHARRMLREDAATLVLGVGGYVMAPTVFAAWTLRIPSVIHESNVAPGMANRACARVARLVLLTYADTARHLPGEVPSLVVGCPVAPKVLVGDRAAARARYGLAPDLPVLLVVGGSLGAATINAVALAAATQARDWQILHVCGPRYHAEILGAYGTVPAHVTLVDYEDRMGDAYAAADLVVCRAGSSTLAELCAVGKASVLIPSPNVTDNHQEANARGLDRAGAARVVVERGIDIPAVVAEIDRLLHQPEVLGAMGQAAKRLAGGDVAAQVAVEIERRFPAP